jgi:hypothetical protein
LSSEIARRIRVSTNASSTLKWPVAFPRTGEGQAQWSALVIFVFAIAVQCAVGTPSDTSWLITVCEKILEGHRLYVDIAEVNPPGAVFLYMPAVWIAHVTNVRPEFAVATFVFVSIGGSLALASTILSQAGLTQRIGPAGFSFTLLLLAALPSAVFDQREHLALLFGLPLIAALVVRAAGAQINFGSRLLAGLCGAIMIAVKIYFVLIIAAPLVYVVWRIGWRRLFTTLELYVFAAVASVLLALSVALFPVFIHKIAPMVAEIYVPQRRDLIYLVFRPAIIYWLVLAAYLSSLACKRFDDPLLVVPVLASTGALVAYFLQGKGWPYQAYPAVALMGMALGAAALLDRNMTRSAFANLPITCTATFFLAFGAFTFAPRLDSASLEKLVASTARHPKVLMIGADIALGFPLTRSVDGEWVGTFPCLWVTDMISHQRDMGEQARTAESDRLLRADRETLVADIKNKRPDAILVADAVWKNWTLTHVDVAAALADYAPIGADGEIEVYGLRPALRPAQ